MNNPFESIEARLSSIENLILDIKHQPKEVDAVEQSEQLLNVEQVAQFLNLSIPTIYSKVSKREIPFMKRGKRLYFSSIELMNYLKDGKVKSNVEIEAEANFYLLNTKTGQNGKR